MNQSTSHTSKGDKSILPRLFPHTQMCDFTSFCCLTIYFTTAASIFTYSLSATIGYSPPGHPCLCQVFADDTTCSHPERTPSSLQGCHDAWGRVVLGGGAASSSSAWQNWVVTKHYLHFFPFKCFSFLLAKDLILVIHTLFIFRPH